MKFFYIICFLTAVLYVVIFNDPKKDRVQLELIKSEAYMNGVGLLKFYGYWSNKNKRDGLADFLSSDEFIDSYENKYLIKLKPFVGSLYEFHHYGNISLAFSGNNQFQENGEGDDLFYNPEKDTVQYDRNIYGDIAEICINYD